MDIKKNDRSAMGIIFLTVFLDLVGFGIIIPLLPYLATAYKASPLEVGLLMSVYSLMQFFFSPLWGRLSDRIGRKPILLMSLLGSSLSYLGFAFGTSMFIFFLTRAFAGLFGANISTAMAYIADITEEKDRSKGMGLIGAAFGLGFVFGPFFGGILGDWGVALGDQPPFGVNFPALIASFICFINLFLAIRILRESLPVAHRGQVKARGSRFSQIATHIVRPVAGGLMGVFFLNGLAMAHMEATLFLHVKDKFGWGLKTASFGFAYVGIVIVFTQGYLVRKLIPQIGERRLLPWGVSLFGFGLLGIAFSDSIYTLAVMMTLLALGNGLSYPSLLGTISLVSSKEEQGTVMGVTQSLAAIGRILGPALGGYFYGEIAHHLPFYVGGGLVFLGLLIILNLMRKIPESGKI